MYEFAKKKENRQNWSAKIPIQEGNNPDYQLRSLKIYLVNEDLNYTKTSSRQTWKQPSFKESVTAHCFTSVVKFKMYKD